MISYLTNNGYWIQFLLIEAISVGGVIISYLPLLMNECMTESSIITKG